MSDSSKTPTVFVIDVQTTGHSANHGQIIELALLNISPGQASSSPQVWRVRLPEGQVLTPAIRQLTGLSDDDLESGVSNEDLCKQLHEIFGNGPTTLIAHYAVFERQFLQALFAKNSEVVNLCQVKWLCTQKLAKRVWPQLPSHTLRALSGYFDLPFADHKRATSHVQATHEFWQRLQPELSARNLATIEEVTHWLTTPQKRPDSTRPRGETLKTYPLEKSLRLSLPDAPGVYLMFNGQDQLLYVGKATSLKSRVNSYFRGLKGRERRKLEMMAQVKKLQVEVCRSPLAAALRESDLIKTLQPKYNLALREVHRVLLFYSRSFESAAQRQQPDFFIGPFLKSNSIETLRDFHEGWKKGRLFGGFYEVFPDDLLQEGFHLFCEAHFPNPSPVMSLRQLLTRSLILYRHHKVALEERESSEEPATGDGAEESKSKSKSKNENENEILISEELDSEPVPPSPEELAQKFLRLFLRAGRELHKRHQLCRLLTSKWRSKTTELLYEFRGGRLILESASESPSALKAEGPPFLWQNLGLIDYDRMSILYSEVRRGFLKPFATSERTGKDEIKIDQYSI